MKLDLSYGNTTETVRIPDENLLGIIYPNNFVPLQNIAEKLREMAESAAQTLRTSRRVLVIVNDYTRPTPTDLILTALDSVLTDKEVRILVALGTHREPSAEELNSILGAEYLRSHSFPVLFHNCHNPSQLLFRGKTRFSTEVWFNRAETWADAILAINSVEPHYFAGYTGGRKSFVPGIAGYQTIQQNHGLVVHANSRTFTLTGNPVHEDMQEAARMLSRPVFSVQLVLNPRHQLYSLHHGDLFSSFAAATRDCHLVYAVSVEQSADIVLSVLRPPYDINFYQAQRAVEFARSVLGKPSVHITVSACRDGIGDDSFIKVFQDVQSAAELLEKAAVSREQQSPFPLGWHKSVRLAQIMQNTALYAVLHNVEDEVVHSAFMRPFPSVQSALDSALSRIGPHAKVYVFPDAGSVVPVLVPRDNNRGNPI